MQRNMTEQAGLSHNDVRQTPCYKPYRTEGGWKIHRHEIDGTIRPTDGEKFYPSKQNAYARAKVLNESISDGTLHHFFVEKKDGTFSTYVQAPHKQEALAQVARNHGIRKNLLRAEEVHESNQ